MKKTILSLCAVLVASSTFALEWNPQPTSEQHLIGVSVGWMDKTMKDFYYKGENAVFYNRSLTSYKEFNLNHQPTSPKVGNTLQVGFTITPEFTYGIGIQTGLYYEWTMNTKTTKEGDYRYEGRINNHEISIPLCLQWRYELVGGLSFFAFTGPSFDFGLLYSERNNVYYQGNLRYSTFHNAYTGKYTEKWKAKEDKENNISTKDRDAKDYKAFHPYWGFGLGLQWEYIRVQLTSDWGIMDVNAHTGEYEKPIYFNKPISVSFSYLF